MRNTNLKSLKINYIKNRFNWNCTRIERNSQHIKLSSISVDNLASVLRETEMEMENKSQSYGAGGIKLISNKSQNARTHTLGISHKQLIKISHENTVDHVHIF